MARAMTWSNRRSVRLTTVFRAMTWPVSSVEAAMGPPVGPVCLGAIPALTPGANPTNDSAPSKSRARPAC